MIQIQAKIQQIKKQTIQIQKLKTQTYSTIKV